MSDLIGNIEDQFFHIMAHKIVLLLLQKYEPPRGKTNNMLSEQVGHKPACTATEAG